MGALDGRRVLVTGASSGIGRGIAEAAAAAGARVALLARRRDVLEEVADGLPGSVVVPVDVSDPAAVADAVDGSAAALGGLDAVVNAAGLAVPAPILEGDPADWQRMFDVNVLGLLAVTQAAVPHLRTAATTGVADVVNVSSMSGRRRASAALTVYSGTKFAVHVISDGLREELHPLGIRVMVLSPGFVATPIFTAGPRTARSAEYDALANEVGLTVESVAAQVVQTLAQPAGVAIPEIAMLPMGQ